MKSLKYFAILIGMLILVSTIIIAVEPGEPYTIEGNKVFINDSTAYISAEPHTLYYNPFDNWKKPQWVNFTVQSKVYTGNVDIVFGFDTESIIPKRIERYNPVNLSRERTYTCDTEYYTFNSSHLWCYENVTTNNETNETELQLLFEHDFESGNFSTKTITWTEYKMKYWHDFSSNMNSINYDYQDMNKWYYAKNLSIVANQTYKIRVDMEVQTNNEYNKYWFAIKPSSETIQEAITNDHFYALDPWINSTGDYQSKDYLTTGMLAYWDFNDSATTLYDIYSGTYNGTVSNADLNATGIVGEGLSFDGATSGVVFSDSVFDSLTSVTISVWLKPQQTCAGAEYAYFFQSENQQHWNLGKENSCNLLANFGSEHIWNPLAPLEDKWVPEQWLHLVVTSTSGNTTIYYNGVYNASDTNAWTTTTDTAMYMGYWGDTPSRYYEGMMDEVGVWNRVLNYTEVADLYNSGAGISYTPIPAPSPDDTNVTIVYPENKTYLSVSSLNYTVNYLTGSCWYSNSSGVTNSSTVGAGTNWSLSAANYSAGTNNYQVWCNSTNSSVDGESNITFFIDDTDPVVNVTSPVNGSTITVDVVDLNYTYSDNNISRCWYTNNSGAWNSTDVAAGVNWTNVVAKIGANSWEVYCNDSVGNIGMNSTNFTLDLIVQNQTFNSTQYATGTYNYKANLSFDSSLYFLYANMTWNGSIYNASVTDVGPDAILSWNQTLPSLSVPTHNISFYFTTYLTNKTDTSDITISNYSVPQNVSLNNITFFECKDIAANTPYAIFDFKDTLTSEVLNATINTLSWTYYIGNGSVNETLLFTNATRNFNYSFCASPGVITLNNELTMTFSNIPTYPNKPYSYSTPLTSVSTNVTLELDDITTGQYVSFLVTTSSSVPIAGVSVRYEKSGVFQGTVLTDDAGSVSIFMDYTKPYELTFTKTGYTSVVKNIVPTESAYLTILSSETSSARAIFNRSTYFSPTANISWSITPTDFILDPEINHTFSYELKSSTAELIYFSFNITNSSGSNITSLSGTTATGGSGTTVGLNISDYTEIIGYLYSDTGDGLHLLEKRYWFTTDFVPVGNGSIVAIGDMIEGFDLDKGERFDFGISAFFVFAILLAGLTQFTRSELQNPGVIAPLIAIVIIGLSYMNFFTLDLGTTISTTYPALEKYGISVFTSLLCTAVYLGGFKRV